MAPGCFSVINKKQDESEESSQLTSSSSSDNKVDVQQSVVHCESRDIIPTIFYTSFVTDQTYLDQIPLPSTNPPSIPMSFVGPTLAPLTTASFIIPLTKSDQCSPNSHDDDNDSDSEDDEDSDSESDSSDSSSSSSDSDDEVDQEDDDDEEEEKPSDVLKSEKTRLKPLPKIRLSKHFYDTVDSFEILEQTILKQKRLSRLKNTDLRKKILLKRTFDLVCEIMDRENGFDDLNDDAKPPTAVVPIEPKTTVVNNLTSPIQSGELHIVQLDQQPPMPTQSQPNETELNDIIYLNLINQSDLIDALNESTTVVDSNNNSCISNISGNSISNNSKKRRFSSDEEEEEEEDEEYYEYEEYEDDYYSKKNIVILNKHQDKENMENQSQSNQSMECTTAATTTCLFYSDAERVAERAKLNSNSPKRTRFG